MCKYFFYILLFKPGVKETSELERFPLRHVCKRTWETQKNQTCWRFPQNSSRQASVPRGRSLNIHLQNQQGHTWISVYLHDLREPNTHSSHLTDISGMQSSQEPSSIPLCKTLQQRTFIPEICPGRTILGVWEPFPTTNTSMKNPSSSIRKHF